MRLVKVLARGRTIAFKAIVPSRGKTRDEIGR